MATGSGDRITQPTGGDPQAFLDAVDDPARRADAQQVAALMREVTGAEPRLWGASIVGFGDVTYPGSGGKERPWFAVGLAPRKAALTLYGLTFYGSHADLLDRLGPHTTGQGCLYLKRLSDVDRDVLAELIARAWDDNHRMTAR